MFIKEKKFEAKHLELFNTKFHEGTTTTTSITTTSSDTTITI